VIPSDTQMIPERIPPDESQTVPSEIPKRGPSEPPDEDESQRGPQMNNKDESQKNTNILGGFIAVFTIILAGLEWYAEMSSADDAED